MNNKQFLASFVFGLIGGFVCTRAALWFGFSPIAAVLLSVGAVCAIVTWAVMHH